MWYPRTVAQQVPSFKAYVVPVSEHRISNWPESLKYSLWEIKNAFKTAYTKNKKEPNTLNMFLFNMGRTIPGVYYRK